MKNCLLYLIGCTFIMWCSAGKAQNNNFTGFYDGSKMELVFHLYILPNQSFALSVIYGSEDRVIVGTWKDDGKDGIVLQESRKQEQPFIVYTSTENSKNRILNFKYIDQNTTAALAYGSQFDKSKLKYIVKPSEHSFSYQYHMEVKKENSKMLFLSRQLAEELHEVYPFDLSENTQEVFIMYNAMAEKPIFKARASLENNELILFDDETQGQQSVGKKQLLPPDIAKDIAAFDSSQTAPEVTKIRTEDDRIINVQRVKAGKTFKAETFINAGESYFNSDNPEEPKTTGSPLAVPPPPQLPKKD